MILRNQSRDALIRVLLFSTTLFVPVVLSAQNDANSRLQISTQCLASGNLQCAENNLQSILRVSPREYRALDLLGVVRVLQKRERDAESLFLRVVHINPAFASGHAHLGLLYLQMNRSVDAVPELQAAVRLDPARADASDALLHIWREQAQSFAASRDFAKALACLTDARALAPNSPDVQSEYGVVALQISLFQDAIAAFERTLELRQNDPVALNGLGRGLMGLSRFEDARQQFMRYVDARPADPGAHCWLGMTLAALQRLPEARAEFEKSLEIDPSQTESYYRLGLMDLDSKDFDSAAKNLRVALDRDPKNSGALTALGRVEFGEKRYSEAVDLLQRAIASDGSLAEAHYYLGLAYARMGRKSLADEELQTSVQLQRQAAEKLRTVHSLAVPATQNVERTKNQD